MVLSADHPHSRTGLLSQYRQLQDRLAETREKYREASSGITERSRRLADLGDELEHIKQQMEERGVSLTDGGLFIKSTRSSLTSLLACTLSLSVASLGHPSALSVRASRLFSSYTRVCLAVHAPPVHATKFHVTAHMHPKEWWRRRHRHCFLLQASWHGINDAEKQFRILFQLVPGLKEAQRRLEHIDCLFHHVSRQTLSFAHIVQRLHIK